MIKQDKNDNKKEIIVEFKRKVILFFLQIKIKNGQ